jgi:hypothetical protein
MLRFDAAALDATLDVQRRTRGMTCAQVAAATEIGATTIARTRTGGRLEVDGVLAMVR